MIRSILIPLDGSSLAELALPYGRALAEKTGARLLLVRAAWADRPVDEHWGEHQQAVVREAEGYLSGVAARVGGTGLEVATAVSYGDAPGVILDQVGKGGADLVVMATHGRSGLGRWVYGSVAKDVLAHSRVPVLLVHAWRTEPAPLVAQPRLVVPLDGSAFAEAALPVATEMARILGGQVALLRALQTPERAVFDEAGRMISSVDQEMERLKLEAEDYLADVAERLELPQESVSRAVRVGDAAETIRAVSQEQGAALVVMATHGRTGLSRLMLGSVAGAVLRNGDVPLLLVRPSEVPPQAERENDPSAAASGGVAEEWDTARVGHAEWPTPLSEAALMGVPPGLAEAREAGGPSPVERMLDAFEAHIAAENLSLRAYHELAEECTDPVVKLLMRMVMADEEQHHGLLERMAVSLRDDIYWTHSPEALPAQPPAGPVAEELIATTRARLREEQEGARHSRELARAQKGLYDGLFELLLQVMAMDSEKHERILRYILRRLETAEATSVHDGVTKEAT